MYQPDLQSLVERARSGDTAAFGTLLRGCREDTARVARRYLGASADADDALQDACAQAFLQLGNLAFPERFGESLCTIVRKCCIWLLRGRVRQVSYEEISRVAPHPQFDFAA